MTKRVQKFRSVEDMAGASILVPPGEGFERFARQCARYRQISATAFPRGVFRFQSIEEAQAARARVTEDDARRRRGQPG